MGVNNEITINFGQGTFTTGTTNETNFKITLPRANTKYTIGCINADVGGSGWQYLNGISCQSCTITTLGGRYALGKVVSTKYSWLTIGY